MDERATIKASREKKFKKIGIMQFAGAWKNFNSDRLISYINEGRMINKAHFQRIAKLKIYTEKK